MYVRACVRARVRVCVRVCVCAYVRACVSVCPCVLRRYKHVLHGNTTVRLTNGHQHHHHHTRALFASCFCLQTGGKAGSPSYSRSVGFLFLSPDGEGGKLSALQMATNIITILALCSLPVLSPDGEDLITILLTLCSLPVFVSRRGRGQATLTHDRPGSPSYSRSVGFLFLSPDGEGGKLSALQMATNIITILTLYSLPVFVSRRGRRQAAPTHHHSGSPSYSRSIRFLFCLQTEKEASCPFT